MNSYKRWLICLAALVVSALLSPLLAPNMEVSAETPSGEKAPEHPADQTTENSSSELPDDAEAPTGSQTLDEIIKEDKAEGELPGAEADVGESAAMAQPKKESAPQADTANPRVVDPLDIWEPVTEHAMEQKPEKVQSQNKKGETPLVVDVFFDDEDAEAYKDEKPLEKEKPIGDPPKKIYLSRDQKKRLTKIKALQAQRAKLQFNKYVEELHRDKRGEPEVRLCSLNLNSYGEKSEVQRIINVPQARRLKRKTKSIVNAILEARCNIVALQGIVGRKRSVAKEGLDFLLGALNKKSETKYEAFLGDNFHSLAYNAFLLDPKTVKFTRSASHEDKLLPRFEEFDEKKFWRAPYELYVTVPGKNGAANKDLVVLNMLIRKSLTSAEGETERARMQNAEGFRQLIDKRQEDVIPENPPIIILAGDRGAPRTTPASQIIEGRMRLTDFRGKDKCVLEEGGKVSCPEPREPRKMLFGVLAEGISREADEKDGAKIKAHRAAPKPGEKDRRSAQQRRLERTAEIYLLAPDLHYAWRGENSLGIYKAGYVEVANGLPDSPLVWVELNW